MKIENIPISRCQKKPCSLHNLDDRAIWAKVPVCYSQLLRLHVEGDYGCFVGRQYLEIMKFAVEFRRYETIGINSPSPQARHYWYVWIWSRYQSKISTTAHGEGSICPQPRCLSQESAWVGTSGYWSVAACHKGSCESTAKTSFAEQKKSIHSQSENLIVCDKLSARAKCSKSTCFLLDLIYTVYICIFLKK